MGAEAVVSLGRERSDVASGAPAAPPDASRDDAILAELRGIRAAVERLAVELSVSRRAGLPVTATRELQR